MILLLAASLLVLAAYLAGEVVTAPARRRRQAIGRAAGYGRVRTEAAAAQHPRFRERVVSPSVRRLAAVALRLSPRATVGAVASRLLSAGLAARISPAQFLAAKAMLGVAGVVFALLLGVASAPAVGIVLVPVLGAAAFLVPDAALSLVTRARRERIRSELPDALDLLAVSVEAGLGLDGAVAKVTDHMTGPLVDEFALALGEMRIGESRHDALRRLADRVPAPEVAAFVRSVIQADQLGISLGRILRVQAADSRLRRQAAAEERAMKAPIKMLFPTVLFIFPAMFLVILGPAILNLAEYLK
ncbi:MAG: type II secretion system F family protein [Gaiellaceae bacterium]